MQMKKWGTFGLAAMGVAAVPGAASAQEVPSAAPINAGNVHWTLGADVVSEYWFRGIAQENQGIIVQPYASVTFSLLSEGNLTLDAYLGTWNSLHYDNPSSDGTSDAWYESDFAAGVVTGIPALDLTLDVSYVNLYNPAGGDIFAEEIDVALAYDDTDLLESFGLDGFIDTLAPYAMVAFEIDGGSDAGDDEGVYLELGIEPSKVIIESQDYPVTLAVPMTVGLGLEDYYQDAAGEDETFGFFDIGVVLSTPLPFIPSSYGAWDASVGAHYILLGDSAAEIGDDFGVTNGEDDSIYFPFGLSMSY